MTSLHAESSHERGDTLVELLLALVILSVSVVSIFSAILSTSKASVEHRSLTSLDAVLKTFAESAIYDIQLQPSTAQYSECAVGQPPSPTQAATYHIVSTPAPAFGSPGSYATIFVTGFTPGSPLTVQMGGQNAVLAPTSMSAADLNGNATLTFQIPTVIGAVKQLYAVKVTDSSAVSSTSPANFSYDTSVPPSTEYPLVKDTLRVKELDWWDSATNAFEPSSGACSVADHSGIQQLTVAADASDGSAAVVSFVVINAANSIPSFTSAGSTTFTVGQAGSFQFQSTAFPAATYSTSSPLPAGVTLSPTGLLAGSPAIAGSFPLVVTATNAAGSATQNFTLFVNQAPTFTSATSTSFVVNQAGTFNVTATGTPAAMSYSVSAGAPPAGVTLSSSGVLSGTATVVGSYQFTIKASNGVSPDAIQSFTLNVNQSPTITSSATTTFVVNQPGMFSFTASGYPTTMIYSVTQGAPPTGVTLSPSGVLSGTATTQGSYSFTVSASNGVNPPGTQAFSLVVGKPPTITSSSTTTFMPGQAGSFTVTASGYPTSFTYTVTQGSPPPGVSLSSSGVLSGTASAPGSYTFTIGASNGINPPGTQSFTLVVGNPPTGFSSASSTTFPAKQTTSFQVQATGGNPNTYTYSLSGNPSFVSINPNTGLMMGTPGNNDKNGSPYTFTVTATNAAGSTQQTFTLRVS